MARGPELPPHVRERIYELKRSAKWGAKPRVPLYPSFNYSLYLTPGNKALLWYLNARLSGLRKLTKGDRDRMYDTIQSRPDITRKDLLAERLTYEIGLRKWRKMNRPYLTPIHAAKRLNWAFTYRHFIPKD
ncbi:hypothetical protein N7501_004014 [Penicillium viridicatum]|nr:hypothetical protein N7501_004014 [Penicillium viridicatum]